MSIYDYVVAKKAKPKPDDSLEARYRPRRLCDVVTTDMTVLCINKWIREFEHGTPGRRRFLMLSGPVGAGKTLMATLALEEAGYELPWTFSCASIRNKKEVEKFFDDIPSRGARRQAVLVEEVDCIEKGVLDVLRHEADLRSTWPFVMVCEKHAYGKAMDAAAECQVVPVKRPPRPRLIDWTFSIMTREGISQERREAEALVDACRGDVRQVLKTLDLNRNRRSKELVVSRRDADCDAIECVMRLLCTDTGSQQCVVTNLQMAGMDVAIVNSMIAENYLDVAAAGARKRQGGAVDDMAAVAEAADGFSIGDIVETVILSTQRWELTDVWSVSAALYPARLVRANSTHPIRFTKMWSKLSNACLRRGHIKEILCSMQKGLGMSLSMDTDYLFGLSGLAWSAFRADVGGAVARWGKLLPYDQCLFLLRLTAGALLKQSVINAIREAYVRNGLYKKDLKPRAVKDKDK